MLNGLYFTSHDTVVRASFANLDEVQHALGGNPDPSVSMHGKFEVTLLTNEDARTSNIDFEDNGLASHLFDTSITGPVIVLGPNDGDQPTSLSDDAIADIIAHVHEHVHA